MEVAGKLQKDMVSKIKEFVNLVEKIKVERKKCLAHLGFKREVGC